MKRIILFLLAMAFAGFTYSQCPGQLSLTVSGDSIIIPVEKVQTVIQTSAGVTVKGIDRNTTYVVDQTFGAVMSGGCGGFIEVNPVNSTLSMGINKCAIKRIIEDRNSQAQIILDGVPETRVLVTQSISYFDGMLVGCDVMLDSISVDHGQILYVSVDGDDATGEVGNPLRPYQTIQAAVLAFAEGDVIHVFPGTYEITDDDVFSPTATTTELYLNQGVVLTDASDTEYLINPEADKVLKIKGNGEVLINNDKGFIGSGTGVLAQLHVELDKFTDIDTLETRLIWRTECPDTYVHVRETFLAKRSHLWLSREPTKSKVTRRTAIFDKVHYLTSTQAPVINPLLYLRSDSLIGGTSEYVEVKQVTVTGPQSPVIASVMNPQGGDNASVEYKVGTVIDRSTPAPPYPDFESTSGNANSGILYLGGATTLNTRNSTIRLTADNIRSGGSAVFVGGIRLDSSNLVIEVGDAVVDSIACIFIAQPHLSNGSTITIKGNFTTQDSNAVVIISASDVDASSRIIFSGTYEALGAGANVVQITDGSADGVIMFKDALLINDGTSAAIATDDVGNIDIICLNTATNSTVALSNLTVVAGTLDQDVDYR